MRKVMATIELTQPILSALASDTGRYEFRRARNGCIVFNPSWIHSALLAGLELAGLAGTVHASDILFDPHIMAATGTCTVGRGKGERLHESIPAGELITFTMTVPDYIPDDALRDALEHTGAFVGISPSRRQRGYGRFSLVELVSTKEANV